MVIITMQLKWGSPSCVPSRQYTKQPDLRSQFLTELLRELQPEFRTPLQFETIFPLRLCCRTGVLFGGGRSLEMVRAEVPALSHAVPQDGNELNSMENLKG
jgi:hypothetical protein